MEDSKLERIKGLELEFCIQSRIKSGRDDNFEFDKHYDKHYELIKDITKSNKEEIEAIKQNLKDIWIKSTSLSKCKKC